MRKILQRIVAHGEWVVKKAERGDENALNWCGFLNLTLLSAIVVVAVLIVWIWI